MPGRGGRLCRRRAQDEAAEAVGCGVALLASGAGADGAGAWLAGGKGDRAARRRLRGRLAFELVVDRPLKPGGAGVVADLVDAGIKWRCL